MEEKMVLVKNRNAGSTGYVLDSGVSRHFEPSEEKKISVEELKQLSYAPGGEYILKNCLIVKDNETLNVLNLEVEPEYFYSEAEVKEILLNGTLDQLEDTLNFAPAGVIELAKKLAVELEIPDTRKRDMISEKTGFNINNAINVNHIMNEENSEEVKEVPKRKTAPIKVQETPSRKVTPTVIKK